MTNETTQLTNTESRNQLITVKDSDFDEHRWREERWIKLCPVLYQNTKFELLPDKEAAQKVMDWKYGSKGLILIGATRRGKSRAAWLRLRRAVMSGAKVRVLNSSAGLNYAAMFSRSASQVEEWFEEYSTCKLLLMDDVFKVNLTKSFESIMHAMLDRRIEFMLPTIITTNDNGNTLAERMTADRAGSFVGRLSDAGLFESVVFK